MTSFRGAPPPTVAPPPDPYGGLTGNARNLAMFIEEDRGHYNNGNPGPSARYKGTTLGDQGQRLYNYGQSTTYSTAELDAVGNWWASRSAAYQYFGPGPKPYNANHDVANFLFNHPAAKSFNFHGQKTGPKS